MTKIGRFDDQVGNSGDDITFGFVECFYDEANENDHNITCKSPEEMNAWFKENMIVFKFYESRTIIDFSATKNYRSRRMALISNDFLEPDRYF